jgi:hypothetical protein
LSRDFVIYDSSDQLAVVKQAMKALDIDEKFIQPRAALSRISHGDFGEPLPTDSSDVGRLFNYVNQASSQLQAFLADAKAHAITDTQLEEARRIQADFLIRDLPSSPQVELAAMFDPAYQIGADWYDALERDGVVFVVVADVCDKGIPSALYMSVFRSLLRLSLVKEWDLCHEPCRAICRAIGTVNTYMAETHGSTAMFATAFVGAYDPQHQQLSYVVAGHEAPLVLQGLQRRQRRQWVYRPRQGRVRAKAPLCWVAFRPWLAARAEASHKRWSGRRWRAVQTVD